VQPLLQWKTNEYYTTCMCICRLRYPECNAHAPYCQMWLPPLYKIFPHYLINGRVLEKKLLNIKCLFRVSLYVLSETFFILRRNGRDMIKNVYWSSCKVLFILVQFSRNLNMLDRFSTNTQIQNFIKIRPVGAELFHVDRRTDMTKLLIAFRNFANSPINVVIGKIFEPTTK